MPIKTIERNFWQASLSFETASGGPTGPGLSRLFAELPGVFPSETGASWEFPALSGSNVRFQIDSAGQVQTSIAVGTNQQGWHVELTAGGLV